MPVAPLFVSRDQLVDIRFHRRVIFFQQLFIAVIPIDRPRDENARIRPDGAARSRAPFQRRRIHREIPAIIGLLIVRKVADVLFIKGVSVPVIACRRCEHLRIRRPAEPFVPLGTIGGNVQEIASLPPPHVFDQAVEQRIVRPEEEGVFHLARKIARGEIVRRPLSFAFHFHIAESVKGKQRFDLFLLSVGHVNVFRFRRAKVLPVKTSVLQNFAELQADLFALFQPAAKAHDPCGVLMKIDDAFPFRRDDKFAFALFVNGDLRRVFRNKAEVLFSDRRPVEGKFAGIVPDLAVVNAARRHFTCRNEPRFVRRNADKGISVKGNFRNQTEIVSPRFIAVPVDPETPFIPAVSHEHLEHVVLLFQPA